MPSELKQFEWVVDKLRGKRDGYFVEVGASHPVVLNNTHELEHHYNWRGLCIDPNPKLPSMYKELRSSRCVFINQAVSDKQGKVGLWLDPTMFGSRLDRFDQLRQSWSKIEVQSNTLTNLLYEYEAPYWIDYLSIDVESPELVREILQSIDFDTFGFAAMSLEHPDDKDLDVFMLKLGYIRDIDLPPLDITYIRIEDGP